MQINDILNLNQIEPSKNQNEYAKDVKQAGKTSNGVEFLRALSIKDPTYRDYKEDNMMDQLEDAAAKMGADSNRASVAFAMSDWDFDKMTEDGFSPMDLQESKFVTIAEKIRIALAKGGMDVSIMGGIDDSAIEAMTDYPQMFKAALEANDLNANDEVLRDSEVAFRKIEELDASSEEGRLSSETIKYMLSNKLLPTINNIYQASISSNSVASSPMITDINREDAGLINQIDRIIQDAGMVVDSESEDKAFWMVENGIGLSSDSLKLYEQLDSLNLNEITNLKSLVIMVDSVAEGKNPTEAYLIEGYSAMDKAREAKDIIDNATNEDVDYLIDSNKPLTVRDLADAQMTRLIAERQNVNDNKTITVNNQKDLIGQEGLDNSVSEKSAAKRILLETQLMMTTQANFSLIKRGISIDTVPLNELVNELSKQETAFYQEILGGEEISSQELVARIEEYEEVLDVTNETKNLPALQLALIDNVHTASIRLIHEEGSKALANATMANAIGSYETMSTEIRGDLGDSITKAFRNIDNILKDLNIDATDENRRAVRILGYNKMEISQESINEIKDIDSTVNRAFKALKPAVVAQMIQDGRNPLDMSMDALIDEAEKILVSTEGSKAEDKYAKFLYKLDHDNSITPEERNSFIGIYRLITQVEGTDGAAIGHLLHQGVDVTMRNLMMAVRTSKREGREYEVSDESGALEDFNPSSLSITQQIEMSFQTNAIKQVGDEISPQKLASFRSEDEYMSMSPDALAQRLADMNIEEDISLEQAYRSERHDRLNQALSAEQEIYSYLEANDVPITANTLSAMSALLQGDNKMYRNLLRNEAQRKVGLDVHVDADNLDEEIDSIMADLIKEFGEAVKTPADMAEAQQKLEEMAENAMKDMLVREDVTEIDVRGMQLIKTQISTLGEVAKRQENYTIPIMVADEMGNLNLKIVRGREDKGLVDIAFSTESMGCVKASFRYQQGIIKGDVTAQKEASRSLIESKHDDIISRIKGEAASQVEMTFNYNNRLRDGDIYRSSDVDFEIDESRDDEIKTSTLYGIARGFIEVLGEI